MSRTSMWIHGNATVVETPENLTDPPLYQGWGATFAFRPSLTNPQDTWLHIPIPTPTVSNDIQLLLLTVYLLFKNNTDSGFISEVHVYDGPFKILPEFGNRSLKGDFSSPRSDNTFTLEHPDQTPNPHRVRFGIGLSFHFISGGAFGVDRPDDNILQVLGAGADFFTPFIPSPAMQHHPFSL